MKKYIYIILFVTLFVFGKADVNAQEIADGTYKIQSALANKFLTAKGDIKNNTRIGIYSDNGSDSQKWNVKHIGGNYYEITNVNNSNQMMDVYGAYKTNRTPIQFYTRNGNDAQKWYIKYVGNGYYNIISKCNNLNVDVTGAVSADGTEVQMFQNNGHNAQKWKFIEVVEPKQTIEDGTYIIGSSLDPNMKLDVTGAMAKNNSNVQLYFKNDGWAQIWNVKYLNDGYYSITTFLDENLSLDVTGLSSVNGTNIQLFQNNGSKAQRWIIKESKNGTYNIVSELDNMYLDVTGAVTWNGTNIQIYHGNGHKAQDFIFTKVDAKKLEDGLYTIGSLLDKNKGIGVGSEVAYNALNVQLKNLDDLNSRKWYVKHLINGVYSITSALDNSKALDVSGGGKYNGANVQLYNWLNLASQKWKIKYASDGTYQLIDNNSGLYLDVYGAYSADGTNIQLYQGNGNNAQRFIFNKTEINPLQRTYEDGYYNIYSALDLSKSLDVAGAVKANGTNVQLYQNNGNNAQIWYLKYLDNGYYSITTAMNPAVSLDVAGAGMQNGTNIQIYKNNGSNSQQWLLKDVGNGYVSIISKQNGLYLDVYGAYKNNGTNIQLYQGNGNNAQKWKLVKNTDKKVYKGIDISHYNTEGSKWIDWNKAGKSEIGFVIIKAAEGATEGDAKFKEYVEQCEKYNIPYGLYLYSHAVRLEGGMESAAEEANNILNRIRSLGYKPTLGTQIFLDMEKKEITGLGMTQLTSIADKFCSIIEANGYSCGIYANEVWFENYLDRDSLSKKYILWLAKYPPVPHPGFDYAINYDKNKIPNFDSYKYWQFASDGNLSNMGFYGDVDVNIGYNIFE